MPMIFLRLDGVAKNKELSANSQLIGWELNYGVRRPDIENNSRPTLHFTPRAALGTQSIRSEVSFQSGVEQ